MAESRWALAFWNLGKV